MHRSARRLRLLERNHSQWKRAERLAKGQPGAGEAGPLILRQAGITQSMSRRANPYDNARMESFMGTLKLEWAHASSFDGESEARPQLFSFIDGYYNTARKHSSLDNLSPQNFENQYDKN